MNAESKGLHENTDTEIDNEIITAFHIINTCTIWNIWNDLILDIFEPCDEEEIE